MYDIIIELKPELKTCLQQVFNSIENGLGLYSELRPEFLNFNVHELGIKLKFELDSITNVRD